MKLSVLIPTHDYKCFTLVAELQRQLMVSRVQYEIIVADDGSRDQVSVIANLRINELPGCRYIKRERNVGRAAIRNFLISEARGEWLLFLDSDAAADSPLFVWRLLDAIDNTEEAQVIMGGLHHAARLPRPEVSLRYRYEKAADRHRSAEERSRHPYQYMTAFNLCVKGEVARRLPFDEHCKEYGFEDAMYGVVLKRYGIKVKHIDNPLLHRGLEENEAFLAKTEAAMRTLAGLGRRMMIYTGVGRAVLTAKKYHVKWLVALLFRVFRPIMRHNLVGSTPNLKVFSFYKLGYLCTKY